MMNDLPTVTEKKPVKRKASKPKKPKPPETMPFEMVSIEVPKATMKHGYEPRRCDVQALTGEQRAKLVQITNGLIAKESKLKSGLVVRRPQDAIKWLLEQV